MGVAWPSSIGEIPVEKRPAYGQGAYPRYDSNATAKTLLIVHDIEGSAGSAVARFQSPSSKWDQGSTNFVADPGAGQYYQCVSALDVAYGAGNYQQNRRAIQIELPGYAGRAYDPAVLDYAARFLGWASKEYGIPLRKLSLSDLRTIPDAAGVCGHEDIPNPDNPSQGGGMDGHTDPGPTFPWASVLASAAQYAGGAESVTGDSKSGQGDDGRTLWPTGYRIGGSFLDYWRRATTLARSAGAPAPVALIGYPISREFVDTAYDPPLTVQYFERARLELHRDGSITFGLIGYTARDAQAPFLPPIVVTKEG